MCLWWAGNREATVEDVADKAQSQLHLQVDQQKSAIKEDGQCTEVNRRTNKRRRGKREQRRVMVIENYGTPSLSSKNAFCNHGQGASGKPNRFSTFN